MLGPDVEVHVYIENGFIYKVSLFESPKKGFHWRIFSSSSFLQEQVEEWLRSYGRKKPLPLTLPLLWRKAPTFTQTVWDALGAIPFGSITTYGELARLLHHPRACRAVGGACGKNPFPLFVPCHRVIASDRSLTGYSEGLEIKKTLLAFENIPTL